jgi:hypothetical protein
VHHMHHLAYQFEISFVISGIVSHRTTTDGVTMIYKIIRLHISRTQQRAIIRFDEYDHDSRQDE